MAARIQARMQAVTQASAAYDALATTHALRALASERVGDLWDAFAAEIGSVPYALPLDLASRAGASPAVRLELERQMAERIHQAMAGQVAPVFCRALEAYRTAVAQGSASPRAAAQIAAYGDDFAATCDALP